MLNIEDKLFLDIYLNYLMINKRMEVRKLDLRGSYEDLKKSIKAKDIVEIKRIIKESKKQGINIVSFRDDSLKLLNSPWSPSILFYRGNLEILKLKTIGIVGSRRASPYGMGAVKGILQNINNKDEITSVSGGAYGIDTACHKYSLGYGIKTCVVLASGLNKIYPPENKDLFKKVLTHGGLILSEYPVNMEAKAPYFPERNRIIAGLSNFLFIAEAGLYSGTMHTAEAMMTLNRRIITIPHPLGKKTGEGCNELIRSGCDFIMNFTEINNFI